MAGQTYVGGDAFTEYTETAMDGGYALKADSNGNADTILLRRDTEERWLEVDPVLGAGEIGLVIGKTYFKVGDAESLWSELPKYDFEVEIIQTTGNRTDAVMSQDAVTKAINDEKSRITQEITDRTTAINNLQSAINDEKTNRTNGDTAIKNTMVKSRVSSNEAFNEVVSELYIDKYLHKNNIKEVLIKKHATENKIQIILGGVDGNYIYFNYDIVEKFCHSHTKEEGDLKDANVTNKIFSEDSRNTTIYAVIDMNKVTKQGIVVTKDEIYWDKVMVNISYSPVINHYIDSYKYAENIQLNAIFKELYFDDLRVTDANNFTQLVNPEAIPKILEITGVHYSNSSKNYSFSCRFYGRYYSSIGDTSGAKYVTFKGNDRIVVANGFTVTTKDLTFTVNKVYAVVDWAYLENSMSKTYDENGQEKGKWINSSSFVKKGVIDITDSPIIYNYIENEALRQQIAQLTSQINNE